MGEREPRYGRRTINYAEVVDKINYKNVDVLNLFITERGKIVPRRISKLPDKKHRELSLAIRRARHLALLPYVNSNA